MLRPLLRALAWMAALLLLAWASVRLALEGSPVAFMPLALLLWPLAAAVGHRLGRTVGSAVAAFLLAFCPTSLSALTLWVERGLAAAGVAGVVGLTLGVVGAAGAIPTDQGRHGAVAVGVAGFAATLAAVVAGVPW